MWETTFAQIANALNDLPIAKSNNSNSQTERFDVITLNRLLLGRNNRRGLRGEGIGFKASANLQKVLAQSHAIFGAWYTRYK